MQSSLPARSPRVLLVDPNPEARELSARLLTAAAYDVFTAGSYAQARQAAAALGDDLDLVIASGVLPDGDGVTLMREMHDLYGCRTLCLTDGAADDCAGRCAHAGIDRCVPRPRLFEQLRGTSAVVRASGGANASN